jgi:tetratricopeptide (TPR) repeat protein
MFRRSALFLILCAAVLPALNTIAADAPAGLVVQLTAQRSRFLSRDNFAGGLLLRELQRQALLISARDELGLATRDMVLREPFSAAASAETVLFESRVWRNEQAQICISHPAAVPSGDLYSLADLQVDDAKNAGVQWVSFKIASDPLVDYAEFVTRCEEASRTTYLDALLAQGALGTSTRNPIPWAAGPASPAALERLQHLDVFSQYLAVRVLHQQMRADGESPERLCALVRGYANLAGLTRDQWSRADRVFLARALLYAQRLVAHDHASGLSLYTRAYARAFAGLHAAALKDLDAADKAADPAAIPPWAAMIRAFCRFDADALEVGQINGPWPYRQLNRYLLAIVACDKYPRDRQDDALDEALLNYPAMFSLASLSQETGDANNPKPTDRPINEIPIIAAEVLKSADLPASVLYAARHLTLGDDSFKQLGILRDRLNHAGAVDMAEPSLAVLGDLLEQQEALAIFHRAQSLKSTGSANADIQKLASNAMPILKAHPWGSYVDALGVDPGAGQELIAKFLNKIRDRDPGNWVEDAFSPLDGLLGNADALVKSLRDTAGQTIDGLPMDLSPSADEKTLWRLRRISPHSGALLAAWIRAMPDDRIQQETPLYRATLAQVESEFINRPEVVLAGCDWCNARGDFNRSFDLVNKVDAIEPSVEVCNRQAALSRKLGRHEDSITEQLRALRLSNEAEDTQNTCQQAAVYLIEDHRFTEALSCVQASADTPSARSLQLAARCYEGMGQLEDANECLRQVSAQFPTGTREQYFWARRLGRRDALQLHAKLVALVNAQPDDFMSRFYLALADDEDQKALDVLTRARASVSDAFSLAQLVILAKQQHDRDALAGAMTAIKQATLEDSFGGAFSDMVSARDTSAALPAFDRWVELQLDMENAVDWYSLAGRYLIAAGHAQEGRGYLAKAIRRPEREKINYALAWRAMVKLGEDPQKLIASPATQE